MSIENKIHPAQLPYISPEMHQVEYRFPLIMSPPSDRDACIALWVQFFASLPTQHIRILIWLPNCARRVADWAAGCIQAAGETANKTVDISVENLTELARGYDRSPELSDYVNRCGPEILEPFDIVIEASGEFDLNLMYNAVAYRTLIVTFATPGFADKPTRSGMCMWSTGHDTELDYGEEFDMTLALPSPTAVVMVATKANKYIRTELGVNGKATVSSNLPEVFIAASEI